MKISILIVYTGGTLNAIHKTILNCRGIVPVEEIAIYCNDRKDVMSMCKLSEKVMITPGLLSMNPLNILACLCVGDWIAIVDENTVVGTQFFLPFLTERLNENKIYYPEHEHLNARYSQFLGVDIDEEYFIDHAGEADFESLVGGMNCVINRKVWLDRVSDNDTMIAVNYSCLKNGMVINVVKGMICKSIVRRTFKSSNHYQVVRENEVKPAEQIKDRNWSACDQKIKQDN